MVRQSEAPMVLSTTVDMLAKSTVVVKAVGEGAAGETIGGSHCVEFSS